MIALFTAKSAQRDLEDFRFQAGRELMDLPNRLRALIETTVLNPEYRSDAFLLLADALADTAAEFADARMTENVRHVTDCLRNLAGRRA